MRQTGIWLIALLLACGGRAKDETQVLEPFPTAGTPATGVGAELPARATTSPAASPASSGGSSQMQGTPSRRDPEAAPPASPSVSPEPKPAERACEPGASRCNGVFVEQCSPESGWLPLLECGQCNGR